MFRALLMCALVAAVRGMVIVNPGPRYPPTKGEVWPKPQQESKSSVYYTVTPRHFAIRIIGKSCQLVEKAVERYTHIIATTHRLVLRPRRAQRRAGASGRAGGSGGSGGRLEALTVNLSQPCEEYPHLDMVESYNLTVSSEASLSSTSVWGVMRGLESFSQLLYLPDDYSEVRVNATSIWDYPRYAHRGLLLDTSRHYLSLRSITALLEAMCYNKMNVLHWHIVDDQSFPFVSAKFPDLSERGAYDARAVYSPQAVAKVIRFAREHGIRVIPEFDVPGHTRSWGQAYPSLLTECYSQNGEIEGLGPMDPTQNQTYKFLRDLFHEVKEVFPDQYLHVGGDEVDHDCWQSNPNISDYMRAHNMSSPHELHALFMSNVLPQLAADTKPIVWQEVVDDGVTLPKESIVQIWKSNTIMELLTILSAGYRVLYSSCWYLDHLASGGDWQGFYDCDPREMISEHDDSLLERIIGGEACMWGEVVDDSNVVSR